MKILDFTLGETLNALRLEMGATSLVNVFTQPCVPPKPKAQARVETPTTPVVMKPTPISLPIAPPARQSPPAVVAQYEPPTTYYLDADDVEVASDFTLKYNGKKVVFHILDVKSYQGDAELPKFHIAECGARNMMRTKNRDSRYVATTRDDGRFEIRIDRGRTVLAFLPVCKRCLEKIDWRGYSRTSSSQEKARIVESFDLKDYFAKYKEA
jgi:hypothetical protein